MVNALGCIGFPSYLVFIEIAGRAYKPVARQSGLGLGRVKGLR